METHSSAGLLVDFLDDSLYHSSPSSLALQSDLGTALFCGYFLRNRFIIGRFLENYYPSICDCCNRNCWFLAIFISKDGRAFLHQLGMPTYQINRILAWLIHLTFAQTTTYQQAQGQIAIGSGGLFGQGFNASNLLIPVRESDMIFTVIAEDFGFIGSVLVIALYLMLIYRMLKITLKSITSSTPIFPQV